MFNKLIASMLPLMPKGLVWQFSKRYIAGKSIQDAIKVSKKLNDSNAKVTIDLLGEFITKLEEAEENKNTYLEIIKTIEGADINGNYSLKPTMFGLLIDKEACFEHIRDIVKLAASYNNFVRIDMEDSQCVDMEIDIYNRIKKEFPNNVGLVLQSYLHRTKEDLEAFAKSNKEESVHNFRLCKGIYVEPKEIAYKQYQEINEHFLEDLEYMFQNNMYPAIATHDKKLVEGAMKLIKKYNVPKDKYEFQMLYGVTPDLRKKITEGGHTIRIYVPYGIQWFAYSTRRLKENPKMANHIIKALFIRG
ncbi:MAG: proline dehydrogenase family protein [Hyphomicrobiales bacterium]